MIVYTANQRRSVRWDGSDWHEEVLVASGSEVYEVDFDVISGSNVQETLQVIDNVLEGLTTFTASGIVFIDSVANVSGVTEGTLGDLDSLEFPDSDDGVVRFSFGVPAQPTNPVAIRLVYAPLGSSSGTFKADLAYTIFDQGDDLTPGSYSQSGTASAALVAGDNEQMQLLNFNIPTVQFSATGSAPFIVSAEVTRDTSVGGNYGDSISVVQVYADNVPGGIIGNIAGYTGGNLEVTGNLTVTGLTALQGGAVPASASDTGISGSIVFADDFLYVATSTNTWKRVAIAEF